MFTFVKFNLKSLFSFTYFTVIFLYLSFAWLLNDPNLNTANIFSSEKITESYDLILNSIMITTFLLFIINHFSNEIGSERKAIIQTRLTSKQLFLGLVSVYFLFYVIGFVIPSYITALLQQYIYAPQKIVLQVFYLKILSGIFSFILFWIILTLWLILKLKDSFLILVAFLILFGISQIITFVSEGLIFGQYWFYKILVDNVNNVRVIEIIIIWFLLLFLSRWLGKRLVNYIKSSEFTSSYRNGFYAKLAKFFNFDLSKHHIQMIGLHNQKILFLFTLLGLLLIVLVINKPNVNLIVLAKVYIGAFVPLLFSFNQYNLIQIDRDAGMIHNNFLRETSYAKIIFNRWLILIFPQMFVIIVFTLLLNITSRNLPLTFLFYILILTLSISSLNLFFAIFSRRNNVANIIIFFFVYIQLREDFQNTFFNNPYLEKLNIFQPLLQQNDSTIIFWHWIVVSSLILFSIISSIILLGKLKFVSLEFG